MRPWMVMFGGLVVWAAHFLSLYFVGSIFPTTALARGIVAVITLVAVGVIVRILVGLRQKWRAPVAVPSEQWQTRMGAATAALSLVAVLWQGLPAIVG